MRVPYSYLDRQFAEPDAILADIRELVRRGDYTLGAAVGEFEERYARMLGARHAIGVGSGTEALTLALQAVGVRPAVLPEQRGRRLGCLTTRPGGVDAPPRPLQRAPADVHGVHVGLVRRDPRVEQCHGQGVGAGRVGRREISDAPRSELRAGRRTARRAPDRGTP